MKTLHIHPHPPRAEAGEVTFAATFEGFDARNRTLFMTFPEAAVPRMPGRCDHFLLAGLFPAMGQFEACHVHGTVSRDLLANIAEFNSIWSGWRPKIYRPVTWLADKVELPAASGPASSHHIMAFSGGVDACATLVRHSDDRLGWRNRPLSAAVMVHGFDIPIQEAAGFAKAFARARRITSSFNLPLFACRTNLRELPDDWEDAYTAKLAAVLHVFSGAYSGGIVASCISHIQPTLPWASNPVTNPMLGTAQFPLHTDGGELNRIEKIEIIAASKSCIQNIRVCWEGNIPGENCGECEKCVRTQLELILNNPGPLPAFLKQLAPGMIRNIRPKYHLQLYHLEDILALADKKQISDWWVDELREVVRNGCGPNPRKRGFWRRIFPKPSRSLRHNTERP